MGPRGFWIALAIVLFYVIARPHIGTVWGMRRVEARIGGPRHVVEGPKSYPTFEMCDRKAEEMNKALEAAERAWADVQLNEGKTPKPPITATSYDCAPQSALLWGW